MCTNKLCHSSFSKYSSARKMQQNNLPSLFTKECLYFFLISTQFKWMHHKGWHYETISQQCNHFPHTSICKKEGFFFNAPEKTNLNNRYRCPIHRQNHFTPIKSTFYKENTTHFSVPKAFFRSCHCLLQQRSVLSYQPIFCLHVMSPGYLL